MKDRGDGGNVRPAEASSETGLRPLVVVGPTAAGKTALAIEVARRVGDAEIVSVDSMQVYRRMDIGTGKATPAQRAAVEHHLLDVVEPSVEFSVGWFRDEAEVVLADLRARGRRPIFVGGTGLYHRVVVDGLELPGDFPEVRRSLEREMTDGRLPAEMHARLAEVDATAADRIDPGNARRVIRALEVTVGSGRPFSSYGPGLENYPVSDALHVGLRVGRGALEPLISARVGQMMRAGFLDEVRSLAAEPAGLSRTARQALGYRELLAHLDGRSTLDEAVAATVLRTRQFAVRQDRWFQRDPRIEWFDVRSDLPFGDRSDAPAGEPAPEAPRHAETMHLAAIVAGRLVRP